MAIYAISDLHLSFCSNKPMDIFGWSNYEEKIKIDWLEKVKEEDLVLLAGDFSWSMDLKETEQDFRFIEELPGRKLLLKGNHDYWWNTVTSMRRFLKEKNINSIDFLYNNSYVYNNMIICGSRGWNIAEKDIENQKIYKREVERLKMSLEQGMKQYDKSKKMMVCMHYPPIKENMVSEFEKLMLQYPVTKCIYGHLHGPSHAFVIEGDRHGIEYTMVSCDYTGFKLVKIEE